jgi:uncharacterized protein YndB with AHSA1/START domain
MSTAAFELSIERRIAATPRRVYEMWTQRLEEWWCPKPWQTRIIELDLRAGGRFAVEMSGPNGERAPHDGVFLEVVPERSIVFTDAFTAGWLPQKAFMVGFFTLSAEGRATRYRAGARHWDEASLKQHESMGFLPGWTAVAAQLAALAEGP